MLLQRENDTPCRDFRDTGCFFLKFKAVQATVSIAIVAGITVKIYEFRFYVQPQLRQINAKLLALCGGVNNTKHGGSFTVRKALNRIDLAIMTAGTLHELVVGAIKVSYDVRCVKGDLFDTQAGIGDAILRLG